METFEHVILGAGPAGLQLAYFFEKAKINYVVLEKGDKCGGFFSKYPHTSKLISINKRFTGSNNPNFNLRHDWNSLLNDDGLLFTNYSNDYYPDSADLCNYFNDFANHFKLNIRYGVEITKVQKLGNSEHKYVLHTQNETVQTANLIVASGLSVPNRPNIKFTSNLEQKIPHYADFEVGHFKNETSLKTYENKKVLLIGGGNSAYELANKLTNYCSNIIILGSNKEYSPVSHYTGDIRAIYMPFLDTFLLKSQNGIDTYNKDGEQNMHIIQNSDEKYRVLKGLCPYYNSIPVFDHVIYCTGWKFNSSVFDFPIDVIYNGKYPKLTYKYESTNNENLFFIGSLMHGSDFRKSSGGFIHGFRYLIKLFTQMHFYLPYEITYFAFDGTMNCYTEMADYIQHKINTDSGMYQMYGEIGDIFYFDINQQKIVYYNNVTLACANTIVPSHINKYHFLCLTYGEREYDIRKLGGFNKYAPKLLHLEIKMFKNSCGIHELIDKFIFDEDFIADFSDAGYYDKIHRTLKSCNLVV